MSNNLSKLLVSAGVDLLVERALGIRQLLEGPVLDDVPGVEVERCRRDRAGVSGFLLGRLAPALYWTCC